LADVGLKEAREKADAIRRQFKGGEDPVAARRTAREALRGIPTFREAASKLHEEHHPAWKNPKHRAQWLSSLERYAFPILGELKVDAIDGPAVRDVLLAIWLEKPETARRVRQRITAVLDWSYAKGFRASEAPTRSVSKGLPRQPKRDNHFAAMPYEDVPALMATLAGHDTIGRLALQFVILTAARSGEVRGAGWEEVDFEARTWTIPAKRMKAGRAHIVPLSDSALAILETVRSIRAGREVELIFPGLAGTVMSDMTLSKALKSAGFAGFTVHGFRSSFRDWAAETTGTPGDVVEAALAHTIANKVEAAYRRTNYLEKRRPLMDAWASYLAARGGQISNVVSLRRR
jgi:integrase